MLNSQSATSALLDLFRAERRTIRFRRRQLIFAEGTRSDSLYFIEQGGIKLTLTSPQGKEAVIATLRAGDFFGHEAFDVSTPPRCANAVALTNVQLAKIDHGLIIRVLNARPSACLPIISHLARMVTHFELQLAGNLVYRSDQRLARVLLLISEIAGADAQCRIPKLSQQELAEMIGTTRQRVNAILQRFKKLGLIEDSHALQVCDSLRRFIDLEREF